MSKRRKVVTNKMEIDQESSERVSSSKQEDIEKEIAKYKIEEVYKTVASIAETLTPAHIDDFEHMETRLFTKYYCTDFSQQKNLDTCYTIQTSSKSRGVTSLLHLSLRHSIFQEQQRIKQINFAQKAVKIKRYGSQIGRDFLNPGTLLCTIYMENGTVYLVHVGMRATLVEINPDLLLNPNLILEDPTCKGFLAIFISSHSEITENLCTLKTKQEYDSMETLKIVHPV